MKKRELGIKDKICFKESLTFQDKYYKITEIMGQQTRSKRPEPGS
jgi:hypothetical protein